MFFNSKFYKQEGYRDINMDNLILSDLFSSRLYQRYLLFLECLLKYWFYNGIQIISFNELNKNKGFFC